MAEHCADIHRNVLGTTPPVIAGNGVQKHGDIPVLIFLGPPVSKVVFEHLLC
jgi:hypothetical protein